MAPFARARRARGGGLHRGCACQACVSVPSAAPPRIRSDLTSSKRSWCRSGIPVSARPLRRAPRGQGVASRTHSVELGPPSLPAISAWYGFQPQGPPCTARRHARTAFDLPQAWTPPESRAFSGLASKAIPPGHAQARMHHEPGSPCLGPCTPCPVTVGSSRIHRPRGRHERERDCPATGCPRGARRSPAPSSLSRRCSRRAAQTGDPLPTYRASSRLFCPLQPDRRESPGAWTPARLVAKVLPGESRGPRRVRSDPGRDERRRRGARRPPDDPLPDDLVGVVTGPGCARSRPATRSRSTFG